MKSKFDGKSKDWKNGYVQAKRDIYEMLRIRGFSGTIKVIEENL